MAQVLTANRLIDGEVVYWRAGGWVEAFAEADRFEQGEAAKAALREAAGFVAANTVVNPYLFGLRDDGRPVKEREVIRALGPSVHLNLGKQADGPAPAFAHASATERPDKERNDDVSI